MNSFNLCRTRVLLVNKHLAISAHWTGWHKPTCHRCDLCVFLGTRVGFRLGSMGGREQTCLCLRTWVSWKWEREAIVLWREAYDPSVSLDHRNGSSALFSPAELTPKWRHIHYKCPSKWQGTPDFHRQNKILDTLQTHSISFRPQPAIEKPVTISPSFECIHLYICL